MAKLFPFRSEPDVHTGPQLVNIDDETADDVFAALSSETARVILGHLYDEPATASDLADAVDTSLQNVRYHLDKLTAAGLVEAVDTWYSSRGTEMTVYAPTSDPLVVTAGREERTTVLKQALTRLVGAVGVLGLASALINRFAPTPARSRTATGDGEFSVMANTSGTETPTDLATATQDTTATGGGDGGAGAVLETPLTEATRVPTATAEGDTVALDTPTATPSPTPTPAAADGGIVDTVLTGPPPGVVFFAGGLLVLALVTAWWYWYRYRPYYLTP